MSNPPDDPDSPRVRRAAGRFVAALDVAIDALEALKGARAALTGELSRPPLRVRRRPPDGRDDDGEGAA
jgi:hypothetical protein